MEERIARLKQAEEYGRKQNHIGFAVLAVLCVSYVICQADVLMFWPEFSGMSVSRMRAGEGGFWKSRQSLRTVFWSMGAGYVEEKNGAEWPADIWKRRMGFTM